MKRGLEVRNELKISSKSGRHRPCNSRSYRALRTILFFTGEPPNFIFQEIEANWQQAVIVGVIAGAVRIVAAVGIFRMMRWGVVLGMVQSVITLATLTFYLPFGVMDAVLSSIALVALVGWWGRGKITE